MIICDYCGSELTDETNIPYGISLFQTSTKDGTTPICGTNKNIHICTNCHTKHGMTKILDLFLERIRNEL